MRLAGPLQGDLVGHLAGIDDVAFDYLPDLDTASQKDIEAFSLDPMRWWNGAPGGRDAIYAGTGIPGEGGRRTGFNMRVRPTIENQGAFQPEGGAMEFNRGNVARPLVGISSKGGKKEIEAGSKAIAVAAERLRALVDVQNASAAHMPFAGGKVKDSGAWSIPMDRKLTQKEISDLQGVAKEYGFADVVDRGEGVTITDFYNGPQVLQGKDAKAFLAAVDRVLPGSKPTRAYTDGVYEMMADEFLKGEGSGAASQKFLDSLVTPELEAAFDANPYLADAVMGRVEADWGLNHGRGDVEPMRRIVASGPGWVARLRQAVKDGTVPSVLAGGLLASMLAGPSQEGAQPKDGS